MIAMRFRPRIAFVAVFAAGFAAASCQDPGAGNGKNGGASGGDGTAGHGGSGPAGATGASGAGAVSGSGPGGAPGGSGGVPIGGTSGNSTAGAGGSAGGASGSGGRGGVGGGATGGSAAGATGGATGGSAAGASGGAAGGAAGGAGGSTPTQATYYVSPSGSDANAGTMSAPFQTVAKARDVVRTVSANMTADIAVYLRGGNYPVTSAISFGPQDSGTNGHRIVYQAYPGETPVLNGATRVTGWTPSSGGIYKAALARSTKLRNLYVNDARAAMSRKTVTSQGGTGTYAVTSGQASWAWASGSNSDGAKYRTTDVPAIAANKDDLEIMNGTTWNENIVCVRDVVTTSDGFRGLLFQQPYGAIAQLPNWSAGFSVSGSHTIYNALELLNAAGQFYFDKSAGTLYYYPRAGEDMATADVEAPVVETIIAIAGASNANRVKNLTFQGITFANTDYALQAVASSRGKATVQGATVFIAYGDGNWHNSKYEITDTLPGMIVMNNADAITLTGNTIKHSGSEGISMINDVVNSTVLGNYVADIAGSGITVGHPQHVYLGDTGAHEKYAPGVEGICTNDSIANNVLYDVSSQPGFGGHAGITAFFVNGLKITNNYINKTAYNGINLGWGWQNFKDSTTCKNNAVNNNRLVNTLNRLHDSGAVYTLGQMPGTTINGNYVKGIPAATSGPTYGLHNDEGSAYITENDNVLDVDPGVKYTINCEDFGAKHDLTILRTYATVNKMGVNPPTSMIDPPVAVADNVWPATQYTTCLNSGIQDAYRAILPGALISTQDYVFPASCSAARGTSSLGIRSSGAASNVVWFAPAGTTSFVAGATMTKASGTATSIAVPTSAGSYKLHVVDAQGNKIGESAALLRVN